MAEQKMPTGFIDPPGPFAPAQEWKAFLAEMHGLPQTAEVTGAAQEAEAQIARLASEGDAGDDFSDLDDSPEAK